MGAFRKSVASARHIDIGSPTFNDMVEVKSSTILPEGSDFPVTVCEVKHVDVHEYASKLDLPETKDYQLEVMLRNGIVPQEVACGHMLDSTDPLDRKVMDQTDYAINKLSELGNQQAVETPPVETPPVETPPVTE